MNATQVMDEMMGEFANVLDVKAEKLDEIQGRALEALNVNGAAMAEGAAWAFRTIAEGMRSGKMQVAA